MPETARNTLLFLVWIQFHTLLNIPAAFFRQFNSSSHLIRMGFITSLNQTIALTIPILTTLLQLKKTDPFSTHPKTMRVAVCTIIIFYLAYTALLRFPLRRRAAIIADHCLLAIGNTSIASLASVLLSPFVFAVFGLLSAAELLHCFCAEFITQNNDDDDEFVLGRMMNNIWTAFINLNAQPRPILPI